MWSWHEEIGAPKKDIAAWRDIDIRAEIATLCAWPVYFANDITAACAAELMFGVGAGYIDYLYIFLGSFLGGGLVLDGHLFPGRTQNAGALGSMPAQSSGGPSGPRPPQLMSVASIYVLERKLVSQRRDASILWRSPTTGDRRSRSSARRMDRGGGQQPGILDRRSGRGHRRRDRASSTVPFPPRCADASSSGPAAHSTRVNRQGLSRFSFVEGSIGGAARAMGGACLPLLANFTQDREVLFKENG